VSSFRGADYDYLFRLGQRLYNNHDVSTRRQIAVTLMAMAESVRGQKIGWPKIAHRYRHLTTYEGAGSGDVIPFPGTEAD
jgi:hypothetical protein